MLKKALSIGIATVGLTAAGSASAILHDFNGAEAGGVVSSNSWDFAPGNSLFVDLAPIVAGLNTGTLYSQGAIEGSFGGTGSINDPGGNGLGWSYIIEAPVTATLTSSGLGFDNYALSPGAGATFTIFYDSATVGGTPYSDITGLGYGDGITVLSGTILAGQLGLASVGGGDQGPLDQFGTNNQPGVTTVLHSGNISLDIDVTFENPLFFPFQPVEDPTTGAGEVDITWSGDFLAPFENENPSDSVVGVTPDYDGGGAGLTGVNDNTCVVAPCDLHVETDSRVSGLPASIPEPATAALMGLGLLGLGARRKLFGKS